MARSEIAVTKGSDGTVLHLPRRFGQAGPAKQMAAVLLLFGGCLFAFAGVNTLMDGFEDPMAAGGIALLAGCGMILASVLLMLSRARIEIRATHIHVVEQVGPLDFRRSVSRRELTRMAVTRPVARHQGRYDGAIARLELWCGASIMVRVAKRYRRHLLRDAAERIAAELGFVLAHEEHDAIAFCSPENVSGDVGTEGDQLKRASVAYADDGLVLTVPRRGFTGPVGSLVLAGFMAVVFPLGLALVFAWRAEEYAWVAWFPAGMAVLGAMLCFGGLVAALRSTVFRVVDGALAIHRVGAFFGEHIQVLPAGSVTDVVLIDRVGADHTKVVKQLQIKAGWNSRRMLKGRDELELRWIATTLREGLGLHRGPENGG
tara:strand:- start:978 stop:2099 length:1122 start_codon:yes stop_codon:yes gene_type:complete